MLKDHLSIACGKGRAGSRALATLNGRILAELARKFKRAAQGVGIRFENEIPQARPDARRSVWAWDEIAGAALIPT
jgi:hypothetical protein